MFVNQTQVGAFKVPFAVTRHINTLIYYHGTWGKLSLDRVIHVTSTSVGSKVTQGSVGVIDLLVKGFGKWPFNHIL